MTEPFFRCWFVLMCLGAGCSTASAATPIVGTQGLHKPICTYSETPSPLSDHLAGVAGIEHVPGRSTVTIRFGNGWSLGTFGHLGQLWQA